MNANDNAKALMDMLGHNPDPVQSALQAMAGPSDSFITEDELAAAQEELEYNKAERAIRVEQAKLRIADAKNELKDSLAALALCFRDSRQSITIAAKALLSDTRELLAALDELDKLEGGSL